MAVTQNAASEEYFKTKSSTSVKLALYALLIIRRNAIIETMVYFSSQSFASFLLLSVIIAPKLHFPVIAAADNGLAASPQSVSEITQKNICSAFTTFSLFKISSFCLFTE